jgi:hypothetical protein
LSQTGLPINTTETTTLVSLNGGHIVNLQPNSRPRSGMGGNLHKSNSTLIHKLFGTRLAKAVLTLVNFAGVATYDNVEGPRAADKFCRNVVVTTAAAET